MQSDPTWIRTTEGHRDLDIEGYASFCQLHADVLGRADEYQLVPLYKAHRGYRFARPRGGLIKYELRPHTFAESKEFFLVLVQLDVFVSREIAVSLHEFVGVFNEFRFVQTRREVFRDSG